MDIRRLVGKNVRALRKAQGWTQEVLAERSGFPQQYISDLERGNRNPALLTLFELAQALEVAPDVLLRPIEDPEVNDC